MRKDSQVIGILHMLATAVLMLLTVELVSIARTLLLKNMGGH
jgi:hypothetical protein